MLYSSESQEVLRDERQSRKESQDESRDGASTAYNSRLDGWLTSEGILAKIDVNCV
jgi:hypothetical protein